MKPFRCFFNYQSINILTGVHPCLGEGRGFEGNLKVILVSELGPVARYTLGYTL